MKASIVGLCVAGTAFAGSAIYFHQQLQAERARADDVTLLSEKLKVRIAQLENAKAELAQQRLATVGSFGSANLAQSGPGRPPPPPTDAAPEAKSEKDTMSPWTVAPREPTPAMQRMMRAQMRANNKRMYGDLVSQLGLSKDDANKLYDLLTEQQTGAFGKMQNLDPTEARARFEETRRQSQTAIADLLGPEGADTLQKYQESMPARGEVDMIARQLEGSDSALNDDQRKRLVAAFTEERLRVPMPEYFEGVDHEVYTKSVNEWQEDYNERTASRAHGILDSDQQTAYGEYQQWQKDMREQFATMGPGPRRFRAGGVVGNTMMIAPAAGAAVVSGTFTSVAPAPTESSAKPK